MSLLVSFPSILLSALSIESLIIVINGAKVAWWTDTGFFVPIFSVDRLLGYMTMILIDPYGSTAYSAFCSPKAPSQESLMDD